MKQKVDPIHSQKSHNILHLLKSLNKITPRKNEQKIKFRSESNSPFSHTVKNIKVE